MPDLAYALRAMRKQPVFTLVAVLTLTLGIGANAAIFSLVYHLLLRPLPFPGGDRLVFVWNQYQKADGKPLAMAIPDYLDRRREAAAIEDAALFRQRDVTILSAQQPEQLTALAVTPSFFTTLQRGPALGHGFTEADATPGADRFAVLTYGLWKTHFGGEASVVGREIRVNGETYVVRGVLSADFELPRRDVAMLVPYSFTPAQMSDMERGNEGSYMIARLRPDATIAQLNAQMRAISDRLIERLPARADYMRNSGFTGVATSMREELAGKVRTWLYLLQAGVVIVLLIACANVANLLLMRASGRHRELAVRAALGAGRWRLVRQLLVEGAALSAIGAAGGLLAGAAGVRGLMALAADQLPIDGAQVLQPAVLAFTMLVSILTAAVFGIFPALPLLRGNSASALKEDTARGTAGRRTGSLRSFLVIAETGLAVVLLISAGLLVKSFARVMRVDPGFSLDHVLTAQIALPPAHYRDPAARRAFWARLIDRTRQIPGVSAAGLVSDVPFSGNPSSGTYQVTGRSLAAGERPPHARQQFAGGDYFRAMGISVIDGQPFDATVGPDTPRVALIDELLARKQFPGRSPLGQQVNFGGPRSYTIVGVVRTINDQDLAQPVPEESVYLSAEQFALTRMGLVVRTRVEPEAMVAEVRKAVQALDPEQAVSQVRTMDQWVARSLSGRRTPMTLLALFGVVALALAALGIYGVLAFGVAQRVREIGIRQALGADRATILKMVLRQGLGTAAVGVAAGLAGSLALTRYLQSLLFGVEVRDAGVFGAVALLLLLVAAAACYIPARRATQVDPMVALRDL
jgi:predicted permease